jgi:hypothetical protein
MYFQNSVRRCGILGSRIGSYGIVILCRVVQQKVLVKKGAGCCPKTAVNSYQVVGCHVTAGSHSRPYTLTFKDEVQNVLLKEPVRTAQ